MLNIQFHICSKNVQLNKINHWCKFSLTKSDIKYVKSLLLHNRDITSIAKNLN